MQWGFEPLTSPLGTPFLILPQCSNTVAWAAEWASNMDDTLHAHFVAFSEQPVLTITKNEL